MGLVTRGLLLSPLVIAVAVVARPFDARGAEPTMPYDPNTTPGCIWWWDNDGFLTCEERIETWGITPEEFFLWNPALEGDCANAQIGQAYCIEAVTVPTSTLPPTTTSTAPEPTGPPTPTPVQDGMVENCEEFYKAANGDTCDKIITSLGGIFTSEEFISWNPAVGSDCRDLWAGYYYCVGIPGTPTTPPDIPDPTETTSVPAGPSPTQDGIISTCNRYHKAEEGDFCVSVVAEYGITLDQFLAWNNALSADCSGFWLGYYYCVGIPGIDPPTTTTTGSPSGPSPTQPGIIETCDRYHKAVAGDTCADLSIEYGITLDQFLEWNTAVSADCSGFWLGYYYCVGVPGTEPPATTTTSSPPPGPSPTQPGIIESCTRYHKAVSGDSCAAIVELYGTFSLEEFLAWNEAVGADCAGLWLGYYYCIGIPGTPTEPPTPTPTGCTSPGLPTPTQPGAICACKTWHKVVSGDTCETIIKKYGISESSFYRWNPEVGTACETLWGGYYVCVNA